MLHDVNREHKNLNEMLARGGQKPKVIFNKQTNSLAKLDEMKVIAMQIFNGATNIRAHHFFFFKTRKKYLIRSGKIYGCCVLLQKDIRILINKHT